MQDMRYLRHNGHRLNIIHFALITFTFFVYIASFIGVTMKRMKSFFSYSYYPGRQIDGNHSH